MEMTVTDKLNGISNTSKMLSPEERIREEYNAALDFALDEMGSQGLEFLRAWREGNVIDDEWPEWPKFLERRNARR